MKRLLLLICVVMSLASPAWGGGLLIGSGVGGVSVGTDSCTGGLLFSWHMENTDVTLGGVAGVVNNGCSVGDTTGTDVNASLSSTQAKDGTLSLMVPTDSDRYSFTWANDIVLPSAGRVDIWFYLDNIDNNNDLFSLRIDADNYIRVNLDANEYIGITHTAGGTARAARTNVSAFTAGAWYHVVAQWDNTAHSGLYLRVGCDQGTGLTNSNDNGTSALGTWSGASGTVYIGDYAGTTSPNNLYIDNIKVYDSW